MTPGFAVDDIVNGHGIDAIALGKLPHSYHIWLIELADFANLVCCQLRLSAMFTSGRAIWMEA